MEDGYKGKVHLYDKITEDCICMGELISTSALGFPPLYFNIKFKSFSSVTCNFTFCFGVLSPLIEKAHFSRDDNTRKILR